MSWLAAIEKSRSYRVNPALTDTPGNSSNDKPIPPGAIPDYLDIHQGGILLSTVKTLNAQYGHLFDTFSPLSVPVQKTTRNVDSIYRNQAVDQALSSNTTAVFSFRNKLGAIPYSTAQQSTQLVELPTPNSYYKQDNKRIINNYPLTYYNYNNRLPNELLVPVMTEPFSRAGAGDVTLFSRVVWPYNPYVAQENPWGPGGALLDMSTRVQKAQAGQVPPQPKSVFLSRT